MHSRRLRHKNNILHLFKIFYVKYLVIHTQGVMKSLRISEGFFQTF
jgi:hypothetical protein